MQIVDARQLAEDIARLKDRAEAWRQPVLAYLLGAALDEAQSILKSFETDSTPEGSLPTSEE